MPGRLVGALFLGATMCPHCCWSFCQEELTSLHVIACRVVEAEEEVVPLRLARIDAARGIGERIEYEVPMDPTGIPPLTCNHSR